ncbi:tetratricopeptide repeat protein [Pseudobacteroides cellulosolvens]|uniref:N-terminal acetyltransferase A, auxiliary subunit n=1 Tax=Pseudobacteroides cellulosolvens ATCC 35603 = DSM 2933 TaxID=398512 RepID=A0A0L6JKB0_9FIRM|nr:tetratricopeptide repeat protein [Pseudobacteroides cellulosolvens]KNY25807.1 N-terminal acetyltransferase A, auxiliary subunit [Pseudobacteroides cellulosolvens ATCC 35603 = DSM 2933]
MGGKEGKKSSETLKVNLISEESTAGFDEYLSFVPKPKASLLPDLRTRGIPYRILSVSYFIISILPLLDKNYFITCILVSLPFILYIVKGIMNKERRRVDFYPKIVVLICFLSIFLVSAYYTISDIANKSFKSKALSEFYCVLPDLFGKFSIDVDKEHFYNIAINLDPQNKESYFKKGMLYEKAKLIEKAENAYLLAIAGHSDSHQAYYRLACIYSLKGQDDKALDMLYRLFHINKKYAPAYNETASIYFRKGYVEKADELLGKAFNIDKNDYRNYHLKGNILLKKGNFSEALGAYSKAIELEPGISNLYFDKAQAQFKLGNFDGALFNIGKALEIDSKSYEYLYFKGIILLNQNVLDKSKECFNSSIRIKQDFILPKAGLALIELKQGKLKKSKDDIKAIVPDNCNVPEACFMKAYILKETQNYDEALKAIDAAIVRSPGTSEYYSLKAAILLDSGDKNKVEAIVNIAIKLNKSDYYAYFIKGNFLLQNNDYKNASIYFGLSTEYNPYFARAYAAKAFTEQKLDHEILSDDYMDMAIRIDPNDYYNYLIKSNVYSLRNKNIAAETARKKAAKLYDKGEQQLN